MRRLARCAGAFVVLVLLAGCLLLSLARGVGSENQLLALSASFAPWALPGYAASLLLLLLLLRRAAGTARRAVVLGVVVSLVGLVLHASWLAPAFVGERVDGDPDLTVLGFNMQFGRADIAATTRLMEREAPDVIVLSEATPDAVAALAGRGIGGPGSAWPHQGGEPLPGAAGTVVLSAHPLSRERTLDTGPGAHRMRVEAPTPFWLTAVHTRMPLISNPGWRHDFAALVDDARQVEGPHVQVGDFNATLDHGLMRDLLDTGLESAAVQANSGWQPTWPTPGSRPMFGMTLPLRMIAIDHVLLSRELSAVSTDVHSVPGSDHQALVARLVLPEGA